MTTYAERNIKKETLMKTDIQYVGAEVWTSISNIKTELRNDFEDMNYDIEDENEKVLIYYSDLDYYCIDDTDYEWCIGSSFDEYMFKDYINDIIVNCDYYLIVAYNSTWDNRTGYKFEDNKYNICTRDYDVAQYVVGSSVDGNLLLLSEYSHDCPMGHRTLIIGLTEKDYRKLEDENWETVIKFAEEKLKSVIEF